MCNASKGNNIVNISRPSLTLIFFLDHAPFCYHPAVVKVFQPDRFIASHDGTCIKIN